MYKFLTEDCPKARELERKLVDFYNGSEDYLAFAEPNEHPRFWSAVRTAVMSTIERKGTCKLLEFGAGMTGLGRYLQDQKDSIEFCVQDVSARNVNYLSKYADRMLFEPIELLSGQFDVICSSYVFEHLVNPRKTLAQLLKSLDAHGSLFLLCPRYDFPGYLSPSCRRRPLHERFLISLWLQYVRLCTKLGGQPAFLIDSDPAVFHGPWFRDADAVHWVSIWDLRRVLPKDFHMRRVGLDYRGWRGVLWERFCLLSVEIHRIE